MKQKILITGATGDVGRKLVRYLDKKGYETLGLVRKNPEKNQIFGDICDLDSLVKATKGIDIVIHLAGLIKGNKKNLDKVNVHGTNNLIHACKKNQVKKIIYISSLDIKFNTPYGISKKKSEEIIMNSGLQYVILRPGLIYGKNFTKGISELKHFIEKHSIIPIPGKGENFFCPLYIEDLNSIIYQIINKNKFNNEDYFVCGKTNISMNKLIDLISYYLDKKIIKVYVPVKFIQRILKVLGISIGVIDNAYINKIESNDKIKKDFDFKPIGVEDKIKEMVEV